MPTVMIHLILMTANGTKRKKDNQNRGSGESATTTTCV